VTAALDPNEVVGTSAADVDRVTAATLSEIADPLRVTLHAVRTSFAMIRVAPALRR
jgi:hypothetical protein